MVQTFFKSVQIFSLDSYSSLQGLSSIFYDTDFSGPKIYGSDFSGPKSFGSDFSVWSVPIFSKSVQIFKKSVKTFIFVWIDCTAYSDFCMLKEKVWTYGSDFFIYGSDFSEPKGYGTDFSVYGSDFSEPNSYGTDFLKFILLI